VFAKITQEEELAKLSQQLIACLSALRFKAVLSGSDFPWLQNEMTLLWANCLSGNGQANAKQALLKLIQRGQLFVLSGPPRVERIEFLLESFKMLQMLNRLFLKISW
jgi:hypothetical protein